MLLSTFLKVHSLSREDFHLDLRWWRARGVVYTGWAFTCRESAFSVDDALDLLVINQYKFCWTFLFTMHVCSLMGSRIVQRQVYWDNRPSTSPSIIKLTWPESSLTMYCSSWKQDFLLKPIFATKGFLLFPLFSLTTWRPGRLMFLVFLLNCICGKVYGFKRKEIQTIFPARSLIFWKKLIHHHFQIFLPFWNF